MASQVFECKCFTVTEEDDGSFLVVFSSGATIATEAHPSGAKALRARPPAYKALLKYEQDNEIAAIIHSALRVKFLGAVKSNDVDGKIVVEVLEGSFAAAGALAKSMNTILNGGTT